MSNLGEEFILNFDNEDVRQTAGQHVGAVIKRVCIENDELHMHFDDGTLIIRDSGQSCCESRYMTCDDDLAEFSGAHFTGLKMKTHEELPNQPDEDGYTSSDTHEVQWVEIMTSKGCITLASHNEHNGYYGGFDIDAEFKRNEE